mmetsp:Transcript_119558/g.178616  ORF Transcript_119558/g.178616 Transcript_119558/m.178616 type:complete len:322 (-) Transcript_119558:298-1263(-)
MTSKSFSSEFRLLILILLHVPQNHCFVSTREPWMTRSPVKPYRQNEAALRAVDDLNPIEIDDVMSEVELALREADSALSSSSSASTRTTKTSRTNTHTEPQTTSLPSDLAYKPISLEQLQDVISTSMGGVVLGASLGALASYQISSIDMLVDPGIPSIILAVIFGAVGAAGALVDTQEGKIIKMLLGTPTTAAVTALTSLLTSFLEALGLAAKRKVEETASEIKAMPARVANSAKEKAKQTADEIKNMPNTVGNAAKEKAAETIEDVIASMDRSVETILSLPARTFQELSSGEANQLAPLLIVPLVAATGILVLTAHLAGR